MPTHPVLEDYTYPGEFLISEASHNRSREAGLVPISTTIDAAQVLGMVTTSGDYAPFDPAATDGTENAAAISFGRLITSATATPQQRGLAVVVRDAEVAGNQLGWPATITPAQQTAAEGQLAALGIIVRY